MTLIRRNQRIMKTHYNHNSSEATTSIFIFFQIYEANREVASYF